MQAKDYIPLIGLKNTDPELLAFFEEHNLGKPPKTLNANQGTKGMKGLPKEISFRFGFDIKNDAFYPPISPKNDNYNFEAYVENIAIYGNSIKKLGLSPDFWEGLIQPNATYEEFKNYFSVDDGATFGVKSLTDLCIINGWFNDAKNEISALKLSIKTDWELMSYIDFAKDNEHNSLKHADALIVKWLFDMKFFNLQESVYHENLSYQLEDILDFTKKHLKNHVWISQLNQERSLGVFISNLMKNTSYKTKNEESVTLFFDDQYIKASGQWQKYEEEKEKGDYKKLGEFEKGLLLTDVQSKSLLEDVTQQYKDFLNNKKV
ncbi:hypothetical protein [Empedobacter sedimenti]|uniref:hypothetical protein n=1 Tax=Empedobacter sedimenti TaxID=3042610 RepID=UPI0024A669CF|nr:hypothetical protein [Empedobacter sedimenti]